MDLTAFIADRFHDERIARGNGENLRDTAAKNTKFLRMPSYGLRQFPTLICIDFAGWCWYNREKSRN